jgi:hypothetical protein
MDKKTAILVIHGIGQQESFETLDAFVRGFSKSYSETKKNLAYKHSLRKFPDWIESAVSVSSDKRDIDIYEYYWAHMTQRKVGASEVTQWVVNVAKGARKFYHRQKDDVKRESDDNLFARDGEFKNYKYLVKMLSFGNWFKRVLLLIARIFGIKKLPTINIFNAPLVNFLGDVTIYSSTDKKTECFYTRKKILDEAVKKVKLILGSDDYSELILVGHSLGSVIAHDVLDRLNKEMNLDESFRQLAYKVKGLVTFGSPLDKIAFFFDEHIDREKQSVRSAIVSQLHGFKRLNVDTAALQNSIVQYFDNVRWLNFWAKTDPVSGHLDVYRDVNNIEMDFSDKVKGFTFWGSKIYLLSHSLYWDSQEMYRRIIDEFNLAD